MDLKKSLKVGCCYDSVKIKDPGKSRFIVVTLKHLMWLSHSVHRQNECVKEWSTDKKWYILHQIKEGQTGLTMERIHDNSARGAIGGLYMLWYTIKTVQ